MSRSSLRRSAGTAAALAGALALALLPAPANAATPITDVSIAGPDGSAFGATATQVSCDLTGSGTPDLAVGTYTNFSWDDPAIAAYVYLDAGATAAAGTLPTQEPIRIFDADFNYSGGVDVRCAGDTNGDGFDDLVIVAQGYGAFIVYGSADFGDVDLNNLGDRGVTLFGKVTRGNGVGDVDGDGLDEVAFTDTKGVVTVVHPTELAAESVLEQAPARRISGEGISLVSVSRAGDMNGDGVADIAVGAASWTAPGASEKGTGAIWVITDLSADVTVGVAPIPGFRIDGPPRGYDLLGTSTVGLGDITGSGTDALLIGGESDDPKTGSALVVLGSKTRADVRTDPLVTEGPAVRDAVSGAQRGWWINGVNSGEHLGHAVGAVRMNGWSVLLAGAMDASLDPAKPSSGYALAIDSRALTQGKLPVNPAGILNVADLTTNSFDGARVIVGDTNQNLGRSFADLTVDPKSNRVTFGIGAPALFQMGTAPSMRVVSLDFPAPTTKPDEGGENPGTGNPGTENPGTQNPDTGNPGTGGGSHPSDPKPGTTTTPKPNTERVAATGASAPTLLPFAAAMLLALGVGAVTVVALRVAHRRRTSAHVS